MKHLLSLISLLLACGYIQAQDADYRPFIEDGKVWVSKCDKDLSMEGLSAENITTHFSSVRLNRKETSEEERYVDQNYFMSGIGPQWYPLWNFCVINNTQSPWLIYCMVGNEILYEDSLRAEYWNIPLPTSITAPHFDSTISSWHTLSGHRLTSPPTRKGVYIRDKKKS